MKCIRDLGIHTCRGKDWTNAAKITMKSKFQKDKAKFGNDEKNEKRKEEAKHIAVRT